MKTSECRSCRAAIIWAVSNTSGKAIPIDAQPVTAGPGQRGLFVLVKRLEDAPLAWPVERSESPGRFETLRVALYVSHFASCPNAAEHRRRPASAAA